MKTITKNTLTSDFKMWDITKAASDNQWITAAMWLHKEPRPKLSNLRKKLVKQKWVADIAFHFLCKSPRHDIQYATLQWLKFQLNKCIY